MSNWGDFAMKHPHYAPDNGTMTDKARFSLLMLISLLTAGGLAVLSPGDAHAAKVKPVVEAPPPAPPPVEKDAPYDRDLLRLSQILGSVHYLRTLCNPGVGDGWREKMQSLLDLEAGKEPARRQKFTAAFNYGYRSFASIHATCTDAAIQAEASYRAEGATLATEITSRFGN